VTVELPGLTVELPPPPAQLPPPLRTDVAGFLGATRRGPVGTPKRVEGLTGYRDVFGDLAPGASTTYAIRGYFQNGGDLAWVTRVAGAGAVATSPMQSVADLTGFSDKAYQVVATSPGTWANGGQVTIWYRSGSLAGTAEVDVRVVVPGEPVEVFTRVPAAKVPDQLTASLLIRLVPVPPPADAPGPAVPARKSKVIEFTLADGKDAAPGLDDYLTAVQAVADQPEVAIVAAPDLGGDLPDDADQQTVVTALLDTAASALDRLVLLDVPADQVGNTPATEGALDWARRMQPKDLVQQPKDLVPNGQELPYSSVQLRACAVYYPGLLVPDPLGGTTAPLRAVPPSGHVAGVISRMDRDRGAYYTPANVVLDEAVDLDPPLTEPEQEAVFGAGLNLLRCAPGRGLQVWGGRTLDPTHQYVAHRRLLHRLVRAVHQVANPLVFDVNGPELRLSLVRAVTSVLLAAFRSGALAGDRPQDAFQVTCDGTNNPPDGDPGKVVCDVAVAPAAPMEFIHLRLLVGPQSQLEVTEA
jgi:phage tail sheath protein FI